MSQWIKKYVLQCFGVIFAALTYFGIEPSDLGRSFTMLAPILYLIAGGIIGWGACKTFYSLAAQKKATKKTHESGMTIEEFQQQFAAVPFDIKAFLKTIKEYGAAYRETDDCFGYDDYMEYLSQFVEQRTMRNGVTKYVFNVLGKTIFEEHPSLLSDVTKEDLRHHEVIGKEGERCSFFSPGFHWWFYVP